MVSLLLCALEFVLIKSGPPFELPTGHQPSRGVGQLYIHLDHASNASQSLASTSGGVEGGQQWL